jgi:signal transduction histidine kinase
MLWWAGAVLALFAFAAATSVDYDRLQQVCNSPDCVLNQAMVAELQPLGLPLRYVINYLIAIEIVFTLIWVVLGVFLYRTRPADPLALFVSFFIVFFGANVYTGVAAGNAGGPLLHLLFTVVSLAANMLSFVFFYVFPDGRFVPRWIRFYAAALLVMLFFMDFLPTLPISILLNANRLPILIVTLLSCVLAQVYRYRRVSDLTQRQQTKIIVLGLVVVVAGRLAVAILLDFVPQGIVVLTIISTLQALMMMLIPISITAAILRYRLWDVDFLINRTLLYSVLTVCVVGVYVLVVGSLGALFRAGDNLFISLLATGVVAVLFQPLRDRLQRAVNHLIYGERDDPYAVLARLGQRLEVTVAPDASLDTIVETVAQALKLPYVAITAGPAEGAGPAAAYGVTAGPVTRLPLQHQGAQVGALLLGPRAPGEQLTPGDMRLLGDLARQIGVAVHAVTLTADLQRSREQLVRAREEERRRIRRDLHDGLGPTLAALALNATTISELIPGNPQAAVQMADALQQEIRGTVADIRRLVYDLRPPTLDDLGLLAAIREVVWHCADSVDRSWPTSAGMPPKIALQTPDKLPALPAAVEVAAYRIVQEALTNVVKHAHAAHCLVRLALRDDALQIEITDDGVGLPGERRAGVGLNSMRERAAELSGTCTIEVIEGGGTRVCACLPLPEEMNYGVLAGLDR